jgi:hypothetical protein
VRSVTLHTAAGLFAIVLAVCVNAQAPAGRASAPATRTPLLPPVVQTCPMHPDVVEDKPGTCPLCRMALVPVRLESVWSCPLHAAVTRTNKGICPICGRELVQMTMALTWTCKGRPDIDVIEPARCPDGSAMIAKRTLRPHGNHNPQHGGQFFMAPDNTHHLEGTLPSLKLFRVYLYDDYARPLPAARVKDVRGRLERGGRTIPLTAVAAGSYLEGRVDALEFPARLAARVQLKPDAPEYRFDFAFSSVTRDPSAANVTRPRVATTATTRGPSVGSATTQDQPDPALIQVPIPTAVPDILMQLRIRDRQVRELIDRGNLAAVFVPAFQARDLAIALEGQLAALPPSRRETASAAIVSLVRAAWLLDASGDIGNRAQAMAAYEIVHRSAVAIDASFAQSR